MKDFVDREAAASRAQEVLALALRHELPPTPAIFHVLSDYLDGADPKLMDKVDRALALDASQRASALARIETEHYASARLQSGLERVRASLASEIADVNERLSDGIKGNLKLAEELRRSLRELAGLITREELQILCRHLVFSGREHLSDTQAVAGRLSRAQSQLSEMRRELSTLREIAARDALTGLHNRGSIEGRADALLGAQEPFCLALIELDDFEAVSRDWGRRTCDNILRGLGQLLRRNIRGRDIAGRLEDGLLALVLPGMPLEEAEALCDAICREFSGITWVSQQTEREIGTLSLTAGAVRSSGADDLVVLMERALARLDAVRDPAPPGD